jgi:hypothetical protein
VIGIYQDSFITYLKDNLGMTPKITGANIIVACPFCNEQNNHQRKHYHLYISLEAPIYHCFSAECHASGIIPKLLKKITGNDNSDKFVDESEIKKALTNTIKITKHKHIQRDLKLPTLDEDKYKLKSLYLKKRFRFNQTDLSRVKGLIFDVESFLKINDIPIDEKLFKIKDYLETNYVGFVTENQSTVIFRNIDPDSSFRHFKISLFKPIFSDYYKLFGGDYNSNIVVLGEGIFDILLEHIYDSTGLRNKAKLYAAGLSTFYESLCKSLVFHENLFRLNVHVLSDNGINLNYYKKIKKFNSHIIDSMTVYYNRRGKDFADVPVMLEKFIIP